jgi:dipeptidyl aminopeptidase/acylaminoacyl peptidase
MEPISFSARDGERIHGYLTVPKGYARRDLPLILDVHGGPWWRVRWGYHHETQFLANRGYAVLNVNYRGSQGYGRRFMEAGFGEVGGRMQDDLLDAVAWAVAQGIVDPKRVAIYGWGYGGYAALAGLTFAPETFAAGVSGAGVTDWADAMKNLPPYWRHTRRLYEAYLGDPDDPADLARMRAISPLFHTKRIESPVLLVTGANDAQGIQDQSAAFVEALESRGAQVEHMLFPDEGRWLQKWQNQVRFHRALENFLGAELGGRLSAYDGVELWIELQQ